MKRVRKILLGFLTVCALACGTASCGGSGGSASSSSSSRFSEGYGSSEHEHNYTETITKNATCTEDGVKTFTCNCGDSYTETIGALGHDTVSVEAQASTCVSQGWDDYVYCTRCDYTTKALLPLDESNHDYLVQFEGKAATCAEFGWNDYEYCMWCDYMTYKEIPATGNHTFIKGECTVCGSQDHTHTWDEGVVTTEPTCTLPGVKTYTCTCTGTMTESVEPLGHDWNDGLCSRCEEEKSKGLKYTLCHTNSMYYYSVAIGTCTDTDIVILSTYDGLPVTSIGNSAFYGCSSLTSITIPDSVTSIGNSAFKYCSSLTSVTIGNSVTSISSDAFYGCSSLTSITIPDSVTSIGYDAFSGCRNLTSITIPDSVTSIDSDAFSGCIHLKYNVYDNAKYLGNANNPYVALITASSTNITFCDIHKDTKVIVERAFYNCSSLTSVTIGNKVTSIGYVAFENCRSLTRVDYNGTIDDWVQISFSYSANPLSYAKNLYINNELVTEANITTATKISGYAFKGCSSLTSVTIPDSVTSIGEDAFKYCSSLTSVVIPDSVTSIGYQAFYGCSALKEMTIPFVGASKDAEGYKAVFGYIFGYTTSSSDSSISGATCQYDSRSTYYHYYIPSSITKVTVTGGVISACAFYNCSSLTSVTIGDSVTSIGSYAFYGCSRLTSINIPDGVTSIGSYAFYGCSRLTSVTIGDSVTSIGSYAFAYCSSLTSVTIGNGVTSIGDSAFAYCSSLTSITIPDSVTSIGSYAFKDCIHLKYNVYDNAKYLGNANNPYIALITASSTDITSCDIHKDTKVIAGGAFGDCSSLTSVTIPDGATSIGANAFYNCSSLTSVTIPDSVTDFSYYHPFIGCSNLTSITFKGIVAQWKAISNSSLWPSDVPATKVVCSDGTVDLD